MTIRVRSTTPAGQAVWLDQLGQVANWRHSKNFPGGASSAQFDFVAPPDLAHPCLEGGATLAAYTGTKPVWRGRLEQPQRGLPWSCVATGAAALAKGFQAHATSGDVYASLNTTVDNAIADGLPWTRTGSLLNPIGSGPSFSTDIDGLLGQLVTQGRYWNLDNDNNVTTPSSPPAVSLLLAATDLPPRTLDGYVTSIAYTYSDGTSSFYNTKDASAALIAKYGVLQQPLDLTSLGALTAAQALSVANAVLARMATTGLPWSGGFTVLPGQLYTLGGTSLIDLATISAFRTVRVIDISPGDGLSPTIDVPIGQVDYDDTTGQLTLTPMAVSEDSLIATIARAHKLGGL